VQVARLGGALSDERIDEALDAQDDQGDDRPWIVVERDYLGRPVRWVRAESAEAATHWDDRWEPVR
jgi:hypothetical protein